jgi:ADP-ribosylglycohydrolase
MNMNLNVNEYRSKALGCWLGKNIGGTLGAPFEWRRQVNDVSFYTQDLGGEPLPNDDLDIQLLWLVAMEEKGIEIDAHVLSEYWTLYVTPHWAEYGTAKINMRSGLQPPITGAFNNAYKDSCGSFIRSEIWACIAPGAPRLAARYAYEDAILDHGNGEGVYAEVFCAALESAAFVEKDVYKLIDIGLSFVPTDCAVAAAVHNAIVSYRSGKPWLDARNEILAKYRGGLHRNQISEDDRQRGFDAGKQGWDAPSNIGMLIIGLLYGEGQFDRSLCVTVNCGEDTDCTGATVGSIFGLMHGAQAIPQKWVDPIGRAIKTACLNLGELGYFGNQLPQNVDDLTDRTERIARQVMLRYNLPVQLSERPTDLSGLASESLYGGSFTASLYENLGCPVFRFPFFEVAVDYENDPTIRDNTAKIIRLRIRNIYKTAANLNLRWHTPEGWQVSPAPSATVFSPHAYLTNQAHGFSAFGGRVGQAQVLEFQIRAEHVQDFVNRLDVQISSDGRPTIMLVPVTLLNGNGALASGYRA